MADPRKRRRMIFDFPERVQFAIRLRALKTGRKPAEVVMTLIEASMADELREADKSLGEGKPPPPRPRKPRD